MLKFANPYRPGAGHAPPYLAGRRDEQATFRRLLAQESVLENMVLTGLRGVGKTVLLESLRPIARADHWLWVGTDLSESASLTEETAAQRLVTDLAVATAPIPIATVSAQPIGFGRAAVKRPVSLDYAALVRTYCAAPGLVVDKLKTVLELVWASLPEKDHGGVVFAYDEAQNLADHPQKGQYPLSMLLDVFQSVQRKGMRFLLLLTGLPTLFPRLVEARTYTERMFRVVTIGRLGAGECRDAILKPIEKAPLKFSDRSVDTIVASSGGYPFFIQFICREAFDSFTQQQELRLVPSVPVEEIIRKLDTSFFAGRWARTTERQRELLEVAAGAGGGDREFTVQELVAGSAKRAKPFSASHVSQMLSALANAGLVYKTRHGRYCFAVPLFGQFIRRQTGPAGTAF